MAEESSEALAVAATSASSETMRFGASASSDQSYSEIKIVRKAQDDETMRFVGAPRTRRRIAREENSGSASYASCLSPESELVVVVTAAAEGEDCGEMSSASCSTSCGEEEEKDRVGKSVVDPEEVEVESALTTSKNLDSPSAASMERVSIISDRDMAIQTSMRGSYKISDPKSDEQESTRRNLDANPTVQIKMPSDSLEIEEFFAAAEKNLHKRFSEKYNFDIVKDVPLEGRYEWVPLKP